MLRFYTSVSYTCSNYNLVWQSYVCYFTQVQWLTSLYSVSAYPFIGRQMDITRAQNFHNYCLQLSALIVRLRNTNSCGKRRTGIWYKGFLMLLP